VCVLMMLAVRRSVRMPGIVMMMVVCMRMMMVVALCRFVLRFGAFSIHEHVNPGCRDAAAIDAADAQLSADVERGNRALQQIFADAGMKQGAEDHVSADSGETFEISNTHTIPNGPGGDAACCVSTNAAFLQMLRFYI